MLCAAAGSVPGRVGFLQISFVAAELWAQRMLYLVLSPLSQKCSVFPWSGGTER